MRSPGPTADLKSRYLTLNVVATVANRAEEAALEQAARHGITIGGWAEEANLSQVKPFVKDSLRTPSQESLAEELTLDSADLLVLIDEPDDSESAHVSQRRSRIDRWLFERARPRDVKVCRVNFSLLQLANIEQYLDRFRPQVVAFVCVCAYGNEPGKEWYPWASWFFENLFDRTRQHFEDNATNLWLDPDRPRKPRQARIVREFYKQNDASVLEEVLAIAEEQIRETTRYVWFDAGTEAKLIRSTLEDIRENRNGFIQFRELRRELINDTGWGDAFQKYCVQRTLEIGETLRGPNRDQKNRFADRSRILRDSLAIEYRVTPNAKCHPRSEARNRESAETPRNESEDAMAEVCRLISRTNLRTERGARTFLLAMLGGLAEQSSYSVVRQLITEDLWGQLQHILRGSNTVPTAGSGLRSLKTSLNKTSIASYRCGVQKGLLRKGKSYFSLQDSPQLEEELYFFVDEVMRDPGLWTAKHMLDFCRGLCVLNEKDPERWRTWFT